MAAGWPTLFEEEQKPEEKKQQQQKAVQRGSYKKPVQRWKSCNGTREQEEPLANRSPVAMGVVVATSLYCGVKAGIQAYQHLRRRNLRHLLRHVAPVLDELGVQYWADFGTLLGMYREKDIILYDNDADLVLLNPDWDGLLLELRAALPAFRVFFVVPSEDRSIRWIRVMSGVGIMDLYGGYSHPAADHAPQESKQQQQQQQQPEAAAAAAPPSGCSSGCSSGLSGQVVSGCSSGLSGQVVSIPQGHGDLCDVPASLIFPLGVMKFRGTPVSVPGDVPGVLRYRYGDTFMIPRYMDKGRDCVEQGKLYARLLGALGKAGLRV